MPPIAAGFIVFIWSGTKATIKIDGREERRGLAYDDKLEEDESLPSEIIILP